MPAEDIVQRTKIPLEAVLKGSIDLNGVKIDEMGLYNR